MRNFTPKSSLCRLPLWVFTVISLGGGASRLDAQEMRTFGVYHDSNPAVAVVSEQLPNTNRNPDTEVEDISGKFTLKDLFTTGSPFYFGLIFGETYDDNIFISQQKESDFITHVSPSIDYSAGDRQAADSNYINIDFRPTLFFYTDHSEQNRTDYYADALYQHQWTRLTLSLEQRYEQLTDPSIDIGNFFRRQIYTTTLNAGYVVDDHLSFGASETQRISDFENQGIDATSEWITDAYAAYQLTAKLALGIGPRIGFVDISGAPNQTYQDLLFRVWYNLTEKVKVTFEGGGEYRQFQGAPDRVFPIFDLHATYTPFDGTELSAAAYRQEVISYSEIGDDYTSTLLQLNIKQRFLRDFFFLGTAGYNIADYQSITGQSSGGDRSDDYYFFSGGIEWDPREWISVSARYQYSADESNFAQNSFNDSQFDFQTSLQF
jgi:hypothetical protein